jgi:pyoverdine/dityrosine biosynthesis protein Dit1
MPATQHHSVAPDHDMAREILKLIFYKRRLLVGEDAVVDEEAEAAPHLDKINGFIERHEPIHMILPAFPAKSPNRRKTLSEYPDKGEELALARLHALCQQIGRLYAPGARVTICSDGRVFAELVKIPDEHVTAYKKDLTSRIASQFGATIDFFDLDDVFEGLADFNTLREELMIRYGEPVSSLKERCKTDFAALEMYRGIVRFLFEDFSGLEEFAGQSKNAIQTSARSAAYRVIQRSNAWTRLLKERFPDAVRLSIHPQPRVSEKIGIFLVEADDAWRTPWHSAIIKDGDTVRLIPRHLAEASNAFLVFENGKPSHFMAPPQ